MDFSEIVIGSLSVLNGGIVGTSLIYFYTKENMWEARRDIFLPVNAPDTDWQLIPQVNKKTNNIQQLKDWCAEKYQETFRSLFHPPNWMKLTQIKDTCLLPIKKKLENSDKSLIQQENNINIEKLKNINENTYKLTYRLRRIKNEADEKDQKKLLLQWCHHISKHGYQNENTNKYRLIEELCIDK